MTQFLQTTPQHDGCAPLTPAHQWPLGHDCVVMIPRLIGWMPDIADWTSSHRPVIAQSDVRIIGIYR